MTKVLVDSGCATITKDDQAVIGHGNSFQPMAGFCNPNGHREARGRGRLGLRGDNRACQVLVTCRADRARPENDVVSQGQLAYVTQEEKESLRGSCTPLR
jgi:hypothetical protein